MDDRHTRQPRTRVNKTKEIPRNPHFAPEDCAAVASVREKQEDRDIPGTHFP